MAKALRKLAKDVRRLVIEKRREHSRKPDCVRDRIERLVAGPWSCLVERPRRGNEAGLFDGGVVPTRRQPSRLVNTLQLMPPSSA
jgi:hypothetical protein